MVQGFHEYQCLWSSVVGEELPCNREFGNVHDMFAVAVKRSDNVVGHVPKKYLLRIHQKMSQMCLLNSTPHPVHEVIKVLIHY